MVRAQILDDVVESVVRDQLKLMGQEAIETALRLRAEALRMEFASKLLDNVIDDVVTTECQSVAHVVGMEAIAKRYFSIYYLKYYFLLFIYFKNYFNIILLLCHLFQSFN